MEHNEEPEEFELGEAEDGRIWINVLSPDGAIDKMPVGAVVGYGELLGYTDAIDALEAGVTYASGEVQELPCEEQYLIIAEREKAREEEAAKCVEEKTAIAAFDTAIREGCTREERSRLLRRLPETPDPRSAELRGALAARKKMDELSGSSKAEDCILAKAQAEARRKVGCCAPDKKAPTAAGRAMVMSADVEPHSVEEDGARHIFSPEQRRKLRDVLSPVMGEFAQAKKGFLHVLTLRTDDPFGAVVEKDVPRKTTDDVISKYRKGQ